MIWVPDQERRAMVARRYRHPYGRGPDQGRNRRRQGQGAEPRRQSGGDVEPLKARIAELEAAFARERMEHVAAHGNWLQALKAYEGIWSLADYRKILSCLHCDSRNSVTEKKLNDAFDLFKRWEPLLVKRSERIVAPGPTLPRDVLDAMRRRKKEQDRAKRAAAKAGKPPASRRPRQIR